MPVNKKIIQKVSCPMKKEAANKVGCIMPMPNLHSMPPILSGCPVNIECKFVLSAWILDVDSSLIFRGGVMIGYRPLKSLATNWFQKP